jgi:CheY-like chemotaxis protein
MKDLKRILLAEDDMNDIELTLGALSDHHLANGVDVVRDGAEALAYLFRTGQFASRPGGDPAVVLLDIKMPKVDGLEVLRRIREDAHLRYLPVVILTSSREESDLLRSYELGVNSYVVKPVQFEAFASAIQQLGMYWAVVNELPPAPAGKAASQPSLPGSQPMP